jgi:AcrR family transcriptional regulator
MLQPPTGRSSRASDTRERIVSATMRLLLDEGYGAVTTRRVGEKAGLNFQLVHYHFESMDDLFIETFRRAAEANLKRLDELAKGEPTLRSFWRVESDANGGKLTSEFVALANHRPALKREIAKYARRFRNAQLKVAQAAMAREPEIGDHVPPMVILLLTTGLAQLVALDRSLGVTTGHKETREWIEQWLDANTVDDGARLGAEICPEQH